MMMVITVMMTITVITVMVCDHGEDGDHGDHGDHNDHGDHGEDDRYHQAAAEDLENLLDGEVAGKGGYFIGGKS